VIGFFFGDSKFKLGSLQVSARATARLTVLDFSRAIERHASGDWGDVGIRGRRANSRALKSGGIVMSRFKATSGICFCVVTTEDRSSTTVLLPAEQMGTIPYLIKDSIPP
jgi:hypothetical protein